MGFEIAEKTLNEARLCKKCFSCLQGNREDLCKVRHCIEGKVHFIECHDEGICAYRRDYGGQKYCDCPVRKELFNKYGV